MRSYIESWRVSRAMWRNPEWRRQMAETEAEAQRLAFDEATTPSRHLPQPEGCEYFISVPESGVEMCDRPSVGVVGVDYTPYCDLHIDEMRAREEAST